MAHVYAVLVTLLLGAWCAAMMLLVRRMDRAKRRREAAPAGDHAAEPGRVFRGRRKQRLATHS